jgi:hypothetical protein
MNFFQATAGGSASSALLLIAIFLIIILVRMRRIIKGTRVSLARTIGYSAYYIAFGVLAISPSFIIGIPEAYLIADPGLGVVGFFAAYQIAAKRLLFWKSGEAIYSKGGLLIYLIYVVGLIARLAISYIYLNGFFFTLPGTPLPALSAAALDATIVTDLLLMGGVGLLFGRNMRLLKTYFGFKKGKLAISDAPSTISERMDATAATSS